MYFILYMSHTTKQTVFDTSINQQIFTDILEQNKFYVQHYNNEINIAKDKYLKKTVDEQYNNDWNICFIKKLEIN